MMKIEVWNDPEEKEEEKVLRLRLVQDGGTAKLVAVNADGTRIGGAHLATISEMGIYVVGSVRDSVGIALNEGGQMKIRTYDGALN